MQSEVDLDRSRPLYLKIGTNGEPGDAVLIQVGDMVIGCDPVEARGFAEGILSAIARIEGGEFLLIRGQWSWSTATGERSGRPSEPVATVKGKGKGKARK